MGRFDRYARTVSLPRALHCAPTGIECPRSPFRPIFSHDFKTLVGWVGEKYPIPDPLVRRLEHPSPVAHRLFPGALDL